MAMLTQPATETHPTATEPLENALPDIPSLPRAIGSLASQIARRTLLPLASAATGTYLMLHGAHYETQLDGTRVEITSDINTHHTGITTDIEVRDSHNVTASLGGIKFPDFLQPLPLSIQATAYPGSREVERSVTDRYAYLDTVEADAQQKVKEAASYYVLRAAEGIGAGVLGGFVLNELAGAAWKNRRRAPNFTFEAPQLLTGLGYSGLSLAIIAGTGVGVASQAHLNLSHYEGYGYIGEAMKPNGFNNLSLGSPVLRTIMDDFKQAHACPDATAPTNFQPGSITVTTYNIKQGENSSRGIDAVADQLKQTNSEVILLQEVDPDVLADLEKDLGMHGISGWALTTPGHEYGNAILTNLPVEYSEFDMLPSPGVEQRGMLIAELRSPINGQPFLVLGTHLTNEKLGISGDSRADIRRHQAEAIVSRLLKVRHHDEAVVLGVDLNDRVHGKAYDVLTKKFHDAVADKLRNASTLPTNGLRFDGIYTLADASWDATSASLGGLTASDHCSITANLKMSGSYTQPSQIAAGENSVASTDPNQNTP